MPLADGNKDVEPLERYEAQEKKPLYLGNRKRTLQKFSSTSHSNLVHGSIRGANQQVPLLLENKKSSIQKEASQASSDSIPSYNLVRKQRGHFSARTLQHSPDETQTTLKEWNALYTTQITKKSKSYHDGILRLVRCGSYTNQVILLNEVGIVLSSKYLKSDECVETGRDYAFTDYLVQICEARTHPKDDFPEGSLEEDSGCKSSRRNKSISDHNVAGSTSMHNEIKNEHAKWVNCGVPNNARFTDNDTKSIHEWNALYTAQKTQKAKKFHDGVLRLVNCGPRMKQIILLNEEGEVLDSMYLKQTGCVETGQTYEFPNYLVEVCESKAPMRDIQNGHSEKVAKCISSDNGRLNHLNDKQMPNEWNVLFTTQMTQKAKTFHDGILRITNCGSHMKQVILLNEEGTVLSSKYLKSVECVRDGHKIEFPNHLVEICALKSHAGDDIPESSLEVAGYGTTSTGKFTNIMNDSSYRPFLKDVYRGHFKEVAGGVLSDSGRSSSLNNRPLRDASQILSFLRRPIDTPQSSNVSLLDVESGNKMQEVNVRNPSEDNQKGEHHSGGNTLVMHGGCQRKLPSQEYSISSNVMSGDVTTEMSSIKLDLEYSGINNECLTREVSDIRATQRPVHSTNIVASSSSSSQEENNGTDENKSLTDEIKDLQRQWSVLSHRVSTIGCVKSPVSFVPDNTHADQKCEIILPSGETSPVCVETGTRSNHSGLQSTSHPCLDADESPSFDLGFDSI